MKRLLLATALTWLGASAIAQPTKEDGSAWVAQQPIRIQLDGIGTGSLVTMLLRDVMRVPYVIAPDVLADKRPTSVRLVIPANDIPGRVVSYLQRTGFTVELDGGTVYVSRKGGSGSGFFIRGNLVPESISSMPSGSPVDLGRPEMPVATPAPERNIYVAPDMALGRRGRSDDDGSIYGGRMAGRGSSDLLLGYVPSHRSPEYLTAVVRAVIPTLAFGAREHAATDSNATVRTEIGPDVLVMAGTEPDLAKARKLVTLLDRARPMVAVKAVVMQVSDIRAKGSALNFLLSIGKGKAQIGSFPAIAPSGAEFVRIASGAVQAIFSAASTDSRFRIVASPNLAVLSGASATINSGSQVPTVGAVVTTEGGSPVQSVVYRDSGITLAVSPTVRGDLVELAVKQERSSFTRTTTGVEDSPTLNKATADASVILRSGESVVLAGLTETSAGNTREGLFGGLLGVRSRDKSETELLIVLTAEIVPSPPTGPGEFIDLSTEERPEDGNAADPLAPVPPSPGAAPAAHDGKAVVWSAGPPSSGESRPDGSAAARTERSDGARRSGRPDSTALAALLLAAPVLLP